MNLVGSRYNPLDYIESDLDAKNVATTISRNSAKDIKEDFFFNTARDLLVGLILLAKADKNGGLTTKSSMNDVKALFNKISENQQFLIEICEGIGSEHIAYQYLKEASVAEGNTRASILSSFAQQTGTFSLRKVMEFTNESDFNFQDLQVRKTIIFTKIPIVSNSVSALTATFFDQLFTKLYKIGDQNGSILPIPTICILDEFANLGKLNDYDNILSTCRGYRLSLVTIIQDFAQVDEKYSKEQRRTFVNNHDTALFLRTKDEETAKYFEESAGDTTVRYTTKSKSSSGGLGYILDLGGNSGGSSPSESEQYQKKPLVSKSELLNMKGDTCYIFTAGRVIELDKAYQSVIYKGFITSTKKVNGRFAYVYPENREKYIKQMGFTPFEAEPKAVQVEQEVAPTIETIPTESTEAIEPIIKKPTFEESLQSEKVEESGSKKTESEEDLMSIYAKQMFDEVFKDETAVKQAKESVPVKEEPKSPETEATALGEQENENKQANALRDAYMIQESDPETAREISDIFSGKNLVSEISKTNEMVNNLVGIHEHKEKLDVMKKVMEEQTEVGSLSESDDSEY